MGWNGKWDDGTWDDGTWNGGNGMIWINGSGGELFTLSLFPFFFYFFCLRGEEATE